MLDLNSILNVATVSQGWVKKPIEWENAKGEKIQGEAEFKRSMSARDFEVIQFGEDPKPKLDKKGEVVKDSDGNTVYETDDDDSRMTRRVQRMVRFNGQHLTAEQAKSLDWTFIALLCSISADVSVEDDSKNA